MPTHIQSVTLFLTKTSDERKITLTIDCSIVSMFVNYNRY